MSGGKTQGYSTGHFPHIEISKPGNYGKLVPEEKKWQRGLHYLIYLSRPAIHFLIWVTGGAGIHPELLTCLLPLNSFYSLIFYLLCADSA